MRSRSISVVSCLAGLLALSQLKAQTQAQSAEAAAGVLQQGSVPRLIRYSGTLTATEVKPGALVGVEFAIYKEESGGVALWSEIQNVEADSSGHFSVLLGSTKNGGLPPDVLGIGEPRWLSATPVGAVAQPRALLVSVPYALRAEEALRIAGAPAGDLVRKSDLTDSVRAAIEAIQSDVTPGHPTPQATSGPTTFSGNNTSQIVYVKQTSTGKAIVASAPSAIGTVSTGGTAGVYGGASAATGIGVEGVATFTGSGASAGVSGTSSSTAGTGVEGLSKATTGVAFGVAGTASSATANAAGVSGVESATTGAVFGVTGSTSSTGPFAVGVQGFEGAATGQVAGVNGVTNSTGDGSTGVNGSEGATTGVVSGLNGKAQSTSNGSAGVNGSENATTGRYMVSAATRQAPGTDRLGSRVSKTPPPGTCLASPAARQAPVSFPLVSAVLKALPLVKCTASPGVRTAQATHLRE